MEESVEAEQSGTKPGQEGRSKSTKQVNRRLARQAMLLRRSFGFHICFATDSLVARAAQRVVGYWW
jgi:hypothetical protein